MLRSLEACLNLDDNGPSRFFHVEGFSFLNNKNYVCTQGLGTTAPGEGKFQKIEREKLVSQKCPKLGYNVLPWDVGSRIAVSI